MTIHTRIRKFNTKDTYPDQDLDNDLCQVVKAGNMLFLRGQVGTDFDGKLIGPGNPEAQTEQAMKNVKQLLEEAGSCLDHICKITIYLTDSSDRATVYRTIGKWLKGVFPVSTGVVVAGLAKPEWLLEVDVIAVIPEEEK
ncbi:MAG: RidA family protein [Proteobacteria bacterium]|jgi:enamine deaminase RidA (YjgF/YER057c/UK114 family)|nr:RidA family protein [Pseudomonadota bacterium]MBT5794341.1 RidA family protein [Deltaproteobacteria bacterium]